MCKVVDQIAHIDLRMVDKADIVLVYFPRVKVELDSILDKSVLNDLEQLDNVIKDSISGIVNKFEDSLECVLKKLNACRVPTYGTIHEIVVARQQRKPVYIVWEGGKETCSGWLMWLVGHQNVFGDVEELISHIDDISKGKAAYNIKDWLLLDLDGDGLV